MHREDSSQPIITMSPLDVLENVVSELGGSFRAIIMPECIKPLPHFFPICYDASAGMVSEMHLWGQNLLDMFFWSGACTFCTVAYLLTSMRDIGQHAITGCAAEQVSF
jgi:hypothetical protein